MNTRDYVSRVYADVDSMDAHKLLAHLTEDCVFIFGNAEPVVGHAAIEAYSDCDEIVDFARTGSWGQCSGPGTRKAVPSATCITYPRRRFRRACGATG